MDAPLQELRAWPWRSPAPDAALRVAFHTLGCRLNQYDTESLRLRLSERRAVRVVRWDEPADLYILNSCTVTAKAEQECRRLARQAKLRHPGCRVVVAGCYAQTRPEALARVPEIDAVVGNSLKDDVAAWLPAALGDDGPRVMVEPFAPGAVFSAPLVDAFPGRSRALVKVQDGCDLRCTYCAIWQARGPGRSRTTADVIAQLVRLRAAGYREAVLTGVQLGSWGRDLEGKERLTHLLRHCLDALPDLRLRLSSLHPNEVSDDLLALCAGDARLRPHLHLSLQSGADSVLKNMKRPYRSASARRAVARVAALGATFGIGADFIVGFPGETETDFAATRRLVEELPFSYVHVFRYSPRPGTAAVRLPDLVSGEVSLRRAADLRALSGRKRTGFRRGLLGGTFEAVIENGSDLAGCHQATTDNFETVMIPAAPGDGLHPGALIAVRVDHERDGRLFARAV